MTLDRTTVCCVVNQSCRQPANRARTSGERIRWLRTVCYACGEAVCTAPGCSTRAPYLAYGTQLVCAKCLEQRLRDNEPTIDAAWVKMKRRMAAELGVPYEAVSDVLDPVYHRDLHALA